MVLERCRSLVEAGEGALGPDTLKSDLINEVRIWWPGVPSHQDEVVLMLDDGAFIQHLNVTGLDLVLHTMGWQSNGNVACKVRTIKKHLPLKIIITDADSEYQLMVTRSISVAKLYGMIAEKKSLLRIGGEPMLFDSVLTLEDYTIFNGSNIGCSNRYMYESQPIASHEFQIFIKGVFRNSDGDISQHSLTQVVHSDMTIEELKNKNMDRTNIGAREQRLAFNGKEVEDHQTIGFYNIHKESTLHLMLRLRGGMAKRGVAKRFSKQEKLNAACASRDYKVSLLSAVRVGQLIVPLGLHTRLIEEKILGSPKDMLEQLNEAFNGLTIARDSTVVAALTPFVTPVIVELESRIESLNQQQEELKMEKESVTSVLEAALIEEFYKEQQFDFTSLFKLVTDRLTKLSEDEEKDRQELGVQEKVQRQVEVEKAQTQVLFEQELQRQRASDRAAGGADVYMADA